MTISFRTIVRGSLAVFGLAALAGQSANAATVTSLFNTGVAGSGQDLNYTLGTSGATPTVATGTFIPTFVFTPTAPPVSTNYSPAAPGSNYIGPGTGVAAQNTFFDFHTTFSLTGFDPSTAVLSGTVSADNRTVAIFLNGNPTSFVGTAADFQPQTFTGITGGFMAGTNTLDFIVLNTAGTTNNFLAFDAGLNLQANPPTVTPEPGSIAMLIGMGVTGAGFLSRRKRAAK